ncbi:Oidioi.mRNA.OKI2018_I69.chr2.g7500.t1.cds [Oikopleura dioica]|uniref:Oidioi.mRNA.OKI2018_I69.chr2.g7500.t1.cds n=1 Tax=Oikopleura dioica TaxID=34765 RepID=A0ABN7TCC1_OIKDI|nr:Oidioi.mRNA.OKI2018_I69.chr2.g7500.t1.cds [Oikopleura dioica]
MSVEEATQQVTESLENVTLQAQEVASDLQEQAADALGNVKEAASEAIDDLKESAVEALEQAKAGFIDALKAAFAKFGEVVKEKLKGIFAACMGKKPEEESSETVDAQDAGYLQLLQKQYEEASKAINDAVNATDDVDSFWSSVEIKIQPIAEANEEEPETVLLLLE